MQVTARIIKAIIWTSVTIYGAIKGDRDITLAGFGVTLVQSLSTVDEELGALVSIPVSGYLAWVVVDYARPVRPAR